MEAPAVSLRGVEVWPGFLGRPAQELVLRDVLAVMEAAPPFHPVTRWGKAMSVAMTSAGRWGWVSDRRGYRYEPRHPEGQPWPPIPASVLAIWGAVAPGARAPECCLCQPLPRERADGAAPGPRRGGSLHAGGVDLAGRRRLFRVGGTSAGGRTESAWLRSGDVCVSGRSRRGSPFMGVDRVREGSSDLVPGCGRINLTLRVVT
jgi:alkylated DNA repair protein (DNA oxidative demethylase)